MAPLILLLALSIGLVLANQQSLVNNLTEDEKRNQQSEESLKANSYFLSNLKDGEGDKVYFLKMICLYFLRKSKNFPLEKQMKNDFLNIS
jgi:hypothetical protein